MRELLIRFLLGGPIVSAFAMLGEIFKPKRFAGLFGAAPSVAIATLTLTVARQGRSYAATEALAMIAGAIGFICYAWCMCQVMMRVQPRALWTAIALIPIWFAVAFGAWAAWLR